MAERVGVIFTGKVRPYVPGERAYFEPDVARDYVVNRGVARYADEDPSEGDAEAPETTHDLNVPEVREVAGEATLDQLEELLESEKNHPRYDGGRSTALAALQEEIEARGEA